MVEVALNLVKKYKAAGIFFWVVGASSAGDYSNLNIILNNLNRKKISKSDTCTAN